MYPMECLSDRTAMFEGCVLKFLGRVRMYCCMLFILAGVLLRPAVVYADLVDTEFEFDIQTETGSLASASTENDVGFKDYGIDVQQLLVFTPLLDGGKYGYENGELLSILIKDDCKNGAVRLRKSVSSGCVYFYHDIAFNDTGAACTYRNGQILYFKISIHRKTETGKLENKGIDPLSFINGLSVPDLPGVRSLAIDLRSLAILFSSMGMVLSLIFGAVVYVAGSSGARRREAVDALLTKIIVFFLICTLVDLFNLFFPVLKEIEQALFS